MPTVHLYDILPYPLSKVVEVVVSGIEEGKNGLKDLEDILSRKRLSFKRPFNGKKSSRKYIESIIKFLRSMGWEIKRFNHHFEIIRKVENMTIRKIKGERFVIISDTHHPNTYLPAFEEATNEYGILLHLGDLGVIDERYFSYIIYGNHDLEHPLDHHVLGRMIGGFVVGGKFLFLGIHDTTFTFLNYPDITRLPSFSRELDLYTILFVSHAHRGFFDNFIPPSHYLRLKERDFTILPVGTLSMLKSSRSKFPVTVDYNILEIEGDKIIMKKKYFGSIDKRGKILGKRILYQTNLLYY